MTGPAARTIKARSRRWTISVLVVDLNLSTGAEQELRDGYRTVFRPAISSQPGFVEVTLLEANDSARWLLLISFASERERLAWVGTPEHEQAWPAIASCCDHFDTRLFERVV